jgi:LPXTG-motif cell wall-anchored protein
MVRRVVTAIAAVLVTLLLAGPATAAGYGNGVSTSCTVDLTARAGKPVAAYVDVKGNASSTIHGTVTVTVRRAGRTGGRVVWSTSVHYGGTPLRLTGPVLRHGRYRAVATFSADPGVYLDCRCFDRFRAGLHPQAEHHTHPGGTLPNTGGPAWWWLLLGGGLLAGGVGVVRTSRRRGIPPA